MFLKRGSWLVPFDEAEGLSLIVMVEVQRVRLARNVYRVKREGAETFQRCGGRPHREEPRFLGLPISPIRISSR